MRRQIWISLGFIAVGAVLLGVVISAVISIWKMVAPSVMGG